MKSLILQILIFINELRVNISVTDYTFQCPQAMKGPLCFSASPLHPRSLQGVVSVQVASLSLHKKGGSGTKKKKKKKKRQRCNKSQPKPLTLTEITAWLVYHRALKCARHSTFS